MNAPFQPRPDRDGASLFFRNGRLALLATAFVLVAGLAALNTLGRQEDPTLTQRFSGVTTFLPGATAARVETLISEPIERRLRELEEIKEVASRSRAGYSLVDVELRESVGPERVDVVWSEVRDKLGELQPLLPADASAPELEVRTVAASTVQVALTWPGADPAAFTLLGRFATELRTRLANLGGTERTDIHGEPEEQVLVTADPDVLAAADLTTAQLAARIAAGDTKRAAGRLRGTDSDLLVEVDGELDSIARIGSLPLNAGSDGGAFLRVGDVARVSKVPRDPPTTRALIDDEPAVVVSATMAPDARIDLWVAAARALIDAFRAELPPAVSVELIFDQNVYTGARLQELLLNLLFALALVLAVLVFFMGVRAAITVGAALPLTTAIVLCGLALRDIPLHQMSVTGLIIALGLLIDNAIVVTEAYKLERRRGAGLADAVTRSVRHLFVPLLASTATTVLAFLPVALAPGATGEFTGTMAVSVILSVSGSFLLAMTLVPAFAAWLDRWLPPAVDAPDRWWRSGFSSRRLTAAYRASLDLVLRRPWIGIAIGLALPLTGFGLATTLTSQFFPPADRDQFQLQLILNDAASIQRTEAVRQRIQRHFDTLPDIERTAWFLGEGAPRVFYNVMVNAEGVSSFAAAWVETRSVAATRAILPELQRDLRELVPEGRIMVLPFEQGPPFDAPIEVRLIGQDLQVLRRAGESLRLILSQVEGVTYTQAALSAAAPKLLVAASANQAADAGLSMQDLPAQLSAALDGQAAGTVMEGTHELPVRVRVSDRARTNVADLHAAPLLPTRTGAAGRLDGLPLAAIADLRLVPAAGQIERLQGERVNTVMGFLSPYILPAAALAEFRQRLEASDFTLPAGYRLSFGGEEAERTESVGNLMAVFVICLCLMLGVVVVSMNSFRQAGIIFLVGFLSVGLALFGVRLFGYPLGFMAIIGTLGLVGLAINGAIIVLAALKAETPSGPLDPVRTRETVVDATRHIVSTTVTTIGGFMPLILFGASFWGPLATAIAGGVLGSAILALYFVPSLYVLTRSRHGAAADGADGSVLGRSAGPVRPIELTDTRSEHAAG